MTDSPVINAVWGFVVKLAEDLTSALGLSGIARESVILLVKSIGFLLLFTLNLLLLIYLERKVLGRIHNRRSITETGPFGTLQLIADFLKLMIKEDIRPFNADVLLNYISAPLFVLAGFLALSVIPWADGASLIKVKYNLLFAAAFSSLIPGIVLLFAFPGQFSKYSLMGAFREGLKYLSEEIPLGLCIVAPALLARSLDMSTIVRVQEAIKLPFAVVLPVGAVVHFIAMSMATGRSPFDISEAESELIAGWRTDITAMKFGLAYMLEYLSLFVNSAIFTILYLGGWAGPGDPLICFLVKVYIVMIANMVVRVTIFRPRPDQVISISWRYLIPLAAINVLWAVLLLSFLR